MPSEGTRPCPLCGGGAKGAAFPYATFFEGGFFNYLECRQCRSVYVDPIPDGVILGSMYAKAEYHDLHYEGSDPMAYTESARLLQSYSHPGATVLDYGCGVGDFLIALNKESFLPLGVEFDEAATIAAQSRSGCTTKSGEAFWSNPEKKQFDVIHLGDVLEHLPNPADTLKDLLVYLKPGGLLFVEGPLEINPSPVYWASRGFGAMKRRVKADIMGNHPPTHLYRTDSRQQLAFILRTDPGLKLKYWNVYETGWPYREGSLLKRMIARFAVLLGGRKFLGTTLGNRFRAIFLYTADCGQVPDRRHRACP